MMMVMVMRMYFLKLKIKFTKSFFLILKMNVKLFELKIISISFMSNKFCFKNYI